MSAPSTGTTLRYLVTGMDCNDCAAEIEHVTRQLAGVEDVRVSIASQVMTIRVAEPEASLTDVERVVAELGYRIDPIGTAGRSASTNADATHITGGYRRALWIVVLLNGGYGVIELAGGFLSNSQALKADALDFMGDGLITLLGIVAIGWGLAWRARSALLQGLFLGALGLGVLTNTLFRLEAGYEPEAGLMSLFGIVALAVNVAAAFVLIPHRTGDANVRAVWLFSRNDAIGNLAVVIAAALVAWTGTRWPDLIVALVIAGLFLQSSVSIILDARRDLREASA